MLLSLLLFLIIIIIRSQKGCVLTSLRKKSHDHKEMLWKCIYKQEESA